jgi:hypothetical protein
MRESQYNPPATITAPATMTGFVPMRPKSCEAMPEEMMKPPVKGR